MKKKFITLFLLPFLVFSLASPIFAEDLIEPTIPEVQTEQSVQEYNNQVDIYNTQVDEYNTQVDVNYQQQVNDYNANVEYNQQEEKRVEELNTQNEQEVTTHNEEEDKKVQENQEELEQYEEDVKQYEEDIKQYEKDLVQYEEDVKQYEKEEKQYQSDLKNENTVKTYYGAESVEDYNMMPFKSNDEEAYEEVLEQAVDRRVVREENNNLKGKEFSETITIEETETEETSPPEEENNEDEEEVTYPVTVTHHFVNNYFEDIKTIVEEQSAKLNDIITIVSLANKNEGTKTIIDGYAAFYTYVNDSYLSYYWYESFAMAIYTRLKEATDFTNTFENGDKYTYTLKNGKQYYSDTYEFTVDYYYSPYLTINKPIEPEKPEEPTEPEEPVKPEEYTPNYWEVQYETPKYKELVEPIKEEYMEKLSHLIYNPPVVDEPDEPVPTEEKEEEIPNEEPEPRPPVETPQEPAQTPTTPAPQSYIPQRTYIRQNQPMFIPYYGVSSSYFEIEDEMVPLASPKKVEPPKTGDEASPAIYKSLSCILIAVILIICFTIFNHKDEGEY